MKKIIFVVLAVVLLASVSYAQTPTKVKECVEWVPVKVPIKYVCGTEWIGSIKKDVWCTRYEDTVKCTKWVDVKSSN